MVSCFFLDRSIIMWLVALDDDDIDCTGIFWRVNFLIQVSHFSLRTMARSTRNFLMVNSV